MEKPGEGKSRPARLFFQRAPVSCKGVNGGGPNMVPEGRIEVALCSVRSGCDGYAR